MTIEHHADLRGFFRDRLVAALDRRRVQIRESTEFYLVELLARFGTGQASPEVGEPLVYRLARAAQEEEPSVRLRRFRDVGDSALYACGFFADNLERRGISRDYVATMGGRAYERARHLAGWAAAGSEAVFCDAFDELADRFVDFALVLDDVRECTVHKTPQDIVRLYERWQRSGSPLLAARLRDAGVYPQRDPDDTVH